MKRRAVLAGSLTACVPRLGRAEAFPDRPLRFVVPYVPGGSTDTSSRIVAEKLAQILGQPVVIENKAGGGTIIGTETVARSKPDGYTLLLSPAALIANAAFGVKVPYDIDRDLMPVTGLVDLAVLLAASNDAPFKSVAELLAYAKADPGRTIPYASAGVGSLTHLWGEFVKARMKLPLEHVGYKGSAEALKDVMAGHVPLFSDVLMPTATSIRAGKVRGLAVATRECVALLTDVPTVGEAGLPGTECTIPFGVSVAAGTPVERVTRLNAAFNEALADDVVRRTLIELGFLPVGGKPEAYGEVVAREIAKWRQVIKDSNIPTPN
jgi:tripartite-type tricarboxylate transporter receptor subunit TctC